MKECVCKTKHSDKLERLETLTDLVEFAEQQRASGSPHTGGWADYRTVSKWMGIIDDIRMALPECAVRDFDDERRKQKEFTATLIRNHDRGG
jgi:hypothetical protein